MEGNTPGGPGPSTSYKELVDGPGMDTTPELKIPNVVDFINNSNVDPKVVYCPFAGYGPNRGYFFLFTAFINKHEGSTHLAVNIKLTRVPHGGGGLSAKLRLYVREPCCFQSSGCKSSSAQHEILLHLNDNGIDIAHFMRLKDIRAFMTLGDDLVIGIELKDIHYFPAPPKPPVSKPLF